METSDKVGVQVSSLTVGLTGCCPACGKGRLFKGFLALADKCSACGLSYAFADAGDGPAVFVILIVGFIVVGSAMLVEITYEPPFWLHAVLWLPLMLVLALGLLRVLKAGLVALQYRNDARQGRLVSKQADGD
jgi:uncharacterized protein (DUF983 family)